jgi:predicted dehydrogenase
MTKKPRSRKLRIVAIGAGYFAQFQLRAWQRLAEAELVAIVERDTSKHKALRAAFGTATLFENLQDALQHCDSTEPTADDATHTVVDIITPPSTHLPLIHEVCNLAQRSTIICQKPFCEDLTAARKAIALADKHEHTLLVHENFRFQPWYAQIKTIIDDGTLGEVYNAHFKLRPGDGQGADAYLDRQPYFRDMPKFLIHETGIHWVDVFRYLFGEPCAVYADLQRLNPVIKGEDSGYFVLHYQSGLRAHFDGNRLLDHAAENTRLTLGTMTVEGSDASLSLNGNGQIELRRKGETTGTIHEYDFNDNDFGGDCVYRLQQHVVDHLINNTPLQNTAAEYLRNVELEAAIYQSAATHTLHRTEPESSG